MKQWEYGEEIFEKSLEDCVHLNLFFLAKKYVAKLKKKNSR
jgi:hypothetical protein